jgi:hypothetical protein
MVSVETIRKLVSGELLFDPCLKDLEGKERLGAKHFGEEHKETV